MEPYFLSQDNSRLYTHSVSSEGFFPVQLEPRDSLSSAKELEQSMLWGHDP